MLDNSIIEKDLVKQKKSSVRSLVGASIFLIPCLAFRLVPAINDTISGKPEPFRAIAEGSARKIAERIGDDFAVILIKAENQDCRRIRVSAAFDSDADTYYLVSYSEASHSVCVTLYGQPTASSDVSSARVLSPATGRNYGHRLTAPVRVVAVDNVYTTYPDSYLSLLHWRARIDSSSFARVGHVPAYRAESSPEGKAWLDIEVDFADLRATVAHRHNVINAVLNGLIVFCLGAMGFSFAKAGIVYRRFSRLCISYDSRPSLGAFLWNDPGAIVRRAREDARLRRQQEIEQARAAILSKRAKEAVGGQLEAIFNALPEGHERDRIRQCLRGDNVGEMSALLRELRSQPEDKTPEERLVALLETLKEYCTPEEFDPCCEQAFQILKQGGFREARSFAVAMHEQLRARFKQAKEEELEREQGIGDRE